MNEKEVMEFANAHGLWPIDARVFAKWIKMTDMNTSKSYLQDWIDRFRAGSGLSHMDLTRLRDYHIATNAVREEILESRRV